MSMFVETKASLMTHLTKSASEGTASRFGEPSNSAPQIRIESISPLSSPGRVSGALRFANVPEHRSLSAAAQDQCNG